MSIELQIQSSILREIISRDVQARLRTICFDTYNSVYVDHVDIADIPVEIFPAHDAIRIHVPLDVFVVQREEVLAAPNAVPAGATMPRRVVLLLELATSGAVASLRCIDVDLGPQDVALGASAPPVKAGIVAVIGSPINWDLTETLQQLGLPAPNASRVDLVGNIVAIRFEPVGNAAEHLFPGQEWGLFFDGVSIEQLARSKVPNNLGSLITSMTITPHWRPAGDIPHVDLDYAGKARVPDPFSGNIHGTIGCDFSLTPQPFERLRTTIHWSLHINLGDLVPRFFEKQIESMIQGAMDPTKFGGTPIGNHAFTLDSPLPNIPFARTRFGYAKAVASPAGMTIGGAVHLLDALERNTVQLSVEPFGRPYRVDLCSTSGELRQTASLHELTTRGGVSLEHCGALCNVEIISSNTWIKTYLHQPAGSTVAETNEIDIEIPSPLARDIAEPVRLIVRTARGVRLVDLGTPPPVELDDLGHVTNALLLYIPDCQYIISGDLEEHHINWGHDVVINSVSPLERNWVTKVLKQHSPSIQLVTLSGLEPGELIQFRSRDYAMDVTADRHGRAMVPAIIPLAIDQGLATLTRVNRHSLAGHFTIRTATFQKQAVLPSGQRNRLTPSVDGTPMLMTDFKDRVDLYEFGPLGTPTLVEERQNPQPEKALSQSLVQGVDLPGLIALHPVPGFAAEPIAIATMVDDSMLVLDLSDGGNPRVAGTFTGSIDALEVCGDMANDSGWSRTLDT